MPAVGLSKWIDKICYLNLLLLKISYAVFIFDDVIFIRNETSSITNFMVAYPRLVY